MSRTVIHTDIAIAGGGCGGTAAAIQAARSGARVVLVEPTEWLGGMLTAAGVVAFDGNWGNLTTGFYREIVRELEIHYGGPAKTGTGWVTLTSFEPKFLAAVFEKLVRREALIQPFFESEVIEALRDGDTVKGFVFRTKGGEEFEVRAPITVEATEYGDLLELAGVEYRFGREARSTTGEPDAPEVGDDEIQDITYVAILKDYQKAEGRKAPVVQSGPNYDPALFRGATALHTDQADHCNGYHTLHTWETFIDYGKLPNNKYMINWPFHANDFDDPNACFDRTTRADAYRRAKQHTLNFIHYMQTVLGHPELGLADDEFPTADKLPLIPYVRESRRIVSDVVMREQDVLPTMGNGIRPPLQKTSVAVGDYFLDHHHARAHPGHPKFFEEKYPDNDKFQVPLGVFFPRGIDGLMAAEKCIGVTHIVNGCSRLQPIVLLMGQAVGALAAMAVQRGIAPRDVPVRDLQEYLIVRGVMLYPYTDLHCEDRIFVEAQKLALAGVVFDDEAFEFRKDMKLNWDQMAVLLMKAEGGAIGPRTPDTEVYRARLRSLTQELQNVDLSHDTYFARPVTRARLAPVLCRALKLEPVKEVTMRFLDMPHTHWAAKWIEPLYKLGYYDGIWHVNFKPDDDVTRKELTLMLDRALDPFRNLAL